MNDLENLIQRGVINAHRQYQKMTDYWLSHAPESFLTVVIAQEIVKANYAVYIDTSLKRILKDATTHKGAIPSALGNRSDISVWYRTKDSIRAAIEVKRAYSAPPVSRDAKKLARIVGLKKGPKTGYIVAYSESKSRYQIDTLNTRFRNWSTLTGWQLISSYVDKEKDSDNWNWGFCILRSP